MYILVWILCRDRKNNMFKLTPMLSFLLTLIVVVFLWTLWSLFSSKVEQAAYTTTRKADGYEIREYPAHIVAETTVNGSYQQAMNQGFRIIAGYIFGSNIRQESVAMTAPVKAQRVSSQAIAMTAPVKAVSQGETSVISFVMPRAYTLETLPTPIDDRVQIVSVPEKKFAVLRFRWYRTDARMQTMQDHLLQLLTRDGVIPMGTPVYAGYNAPWTAPWMMRHEVMVEVTGM